MQQSVQSFNIPIWATQGHLIIVYAPGGGELKPYLARVGNLNWKCQIFLAKYKCLKESSIAFKKYITKNNLTNEDRQCQPYLHTLI